MIAGTRPGSHHGWRPQRRNVLRACFLGSAMFVVGCSISLWVKLHFPNDQLDADFGRQAMQGVPTPAAVPPRVVIDRPLRASRRKELESPEPIDMKPIPPAIPPGNAAREAALPADPSPAVVPQRHSAPAANGDISVAMIKSNHLPQDRPLKLVIGVPTVPRKKGDYLDMTLDALLDSLPDDPAHPWYDQVLIYVLSTAEVHASYDAARARLSVLPKGRYVKFVQAPTTQQDAGRPGGKNVKGMPTAKVRKQSLDVLNLLRHVVSDTDAEYYMFMEDDLKPCANLIDVLDSTLRKATSWFPDWIMIRMCYGLMGAVMKTRDLPHFTSYLNEHYGRRPPDHLIVEWYAGEKPQSAEYVGSRVHLTFKFNMFEHLGDSSTLRSGKMPKFAGCYNYLEAPVLFEVDSFNFTACDHTDLSPCDASFGSPPADRIAQQAAETTDWLAISGLNEPPKHLKKGDPYPIVPKRRGY